MPPALVEGILKKAQEDEDKAIKSVTVEKQIDLTYDLAHLAGFDTNPIDLKTFRSNNKDQFITELTRENAQLVVNKLWDLQTKREDNVVVAILPRATYNLPREKPAPKAKPLTKWEQFSKEKGISHRKKEKLVWDEVAKEWKPRFGYRGINQQKDQWVIEVPENADPETDFFEKKTDERKERVAKNEVQRLRNIARSTRLKLPGTGGIIPNVDQTKDQLNAAQSIAKQSTASLGKFTESLPDEKPAKNLGKRRKFESNLDSLNEEKERNLKMASSVLASLKKPIDDSAEEQALQSIKKLKRSKSKGRSSSGDDDNEDQEDIGDKFDKKNRKRGGGGPSGRGGGGGRGRGGGAPRGGGGGRSDFSDRRSGPSGGGGSKFGSGGRGRGRGGGGRGGGGSFGGPPTRGGGSKFGGRGGSRKPGARGGGKRR